MTELLPCPFCGGEAVLERSLPTGFDGEEWYYIYCSRAKESRGNKCHANPVISKMGENAKKRAIEAWNTRPRNWHTGTPSDPHSLYLVLWFDTEDRVYRYSVLNWHDRLNCWYDEETPDSLWGNEYKAKVLMWMPIGTPIRAARQLLESQQKGR